MARKALVMALALAIMSAVIADEQKLDEPAIQGRQLNWGYLNKPTYSNGDMDGSSSMMLPAQAKSSSGFQAHAPQSLDGSSDINRDGGYSASSGGGDFGYEASADSSYGSGTSGYGGGYGYDYQRFLPTTSKPFYSSPSNFYPQNSKTSTIPNAYLRGMPRDQLDHPGSSLSGMQSSRYPSFLYPSSTAGSVWMAGNNSDVNGQNQMTNRAGYDEDIPLGGISSSTSSSGLLSGTTMRNSLSRNDDLGYGAFSGGFGFGSIPPAGVGYGYGAGSFASPGYSSNYLGGPLGATGAYGSYASYGSPSYSYAGYGGGYANSYGSSYGSSYGYPSYSSYGNSNRSPLYSSYGGSGSYGYGYPASATYYKKPKKAFFDWWKGKDVVPYAYGSSYGYGGNAYGGSYGYPAPYDYYYDEPGFWQLSKFAFKKLMKSMFKPFFKWLPFCSPFYYYDREDRADDKLGGFVSALTAFLPIGLFMAAIVPNIITVSSGRRKRSEAEEARAVRDEATFPILDMISSFGVRALQEPECQSKIVCEIGRMGGLPEANAVQRALWLTANYVPERMSRLVGLDKLFRQIRSQQCSDLKCSSG